jgi:hypothetical protein
LVIETMHRDRIARVFTPRMWDRLPDGSLFLQEHEPDWAVGEFSVLHLIVTAEGERIERRFVHRLYTVTEWTAMLREAGFYEIESFADWQGATALSPDARLIMRARRR